MPSRNRDRVCVRGKEFHSVEACAAHFGVTPQTVRRARRRGKLDRLGLGPRGPRRRMRVTIRGVEYESVEKAAKVFGVKPSTIYAALANDRIDRVGVGRGRAKTCRNDHKAQPIRLGSLEFPSLRAASLALGYHEKHISQLRRRGYGFESIIGRAMEYARKRELENGDYARGEDQEEGERHSR